MKPTKRATLLANVPIESWPEIDTSVLPPEDVVWVEVRIRALTMYAHGEAHRNIQTETGISRKEVARYLERCTGLASDGKVLGFRALIPHRRLASYSRSAAVSHQKGDGSAGCAGALGQLFDRFPGLQLLMDQEFLRTVPTEKNHDTRIRITTLHQKFVGWLREHGLADDEWPLNTNNEGEEALRRYCNGLLDTNPNRWIAARSGQNAARRNKLGTGVHRAFSIHRPFGAVQLDFHKIDAACVITVENSFGVEIEVPLARWHIGLLLEERLELIIGAVIALEITPSSDSVLETIECALAPVLINAQSNPIAIGMGAHVFPNQLFERLRGQCFSVLRMDNGWSNTAVDVINNVVDVVGCAVNFGPVRCWWGRDAIERVFGQMTRESLQRSPSTYGANSADPKKRDPNAMATKLRIRLSDLVHAFERVIANHNSTRSEAVAMASPLAAIEAAMNNPRSLFIPAPLPAVKRELSMVLYKTILVTVRGSTKVGERPYVKIGRWRYSNERIGHDYSLIGKELKVYCSIRDARLVEATLVESGENLGKLVPPRRWAQTLISFRDRALWFRAGSDQRRSERGHRRPDWIPLRDGPITESPVSAKDALALVRAEIAQSRLEREESSRPPPLHYPGASDEPTPNQRESGLFSLERFIDIDEVIMRDD